MTETEKPTCKLCGKISPKIICDACGDHLRGEALDRKKKDEKIKE